MMQVTKIQLSGHQQGKHLYSNFLKSSFYKWNVLLTRILRREKLKSRRGRRDEAEKGVQKFLKKEAVSKEGSNPKGGVRRGKEQLESHTSPSLSPSLPSSLSFPRKKKRTNVTTNLHALLRRPRCFCAHLRSCRHCRGRLMVFSPPVGF